MWDHGWMWGWGLIPMFVGGIVPLFLFGLLVFLAVQALGGRRAAAPPPPGAMPPPQTTPRGETALEIAQRRYAAGELTRDEFLRIRDDLAAPSGGAPPPTT